MTLALAERKPAEDCKLIHREAHARDWSKHGVFRVCDDLAY